MLFYFELSRKGRLTLYGCDLQSKTLFSAIDNI